jgi:hypothetical protein
MNPFKQPDWEYVKKTYPNEYEALRGYYLSGCKYSIVDCRKFTPEEISMVHRCWIDLSEFGYSMYFRILEKIDRPGCKGVSWTTKTTPLIRDYSKDLKAEDMPFDIPVSELENHYIVSLAKMFDEDSDFIFRISDVNFPNAHVDTSDRKKLYNRIREIIDNDDAFNGCLKLY